MRAAALCAVIALAAASACARHDAADIRFHGILLTPPHGKPAFTFTSTTGKSYDFRRETDGKATLLFFGYTHCPDVCPLQMTNIAAALRKVPADARRNVRVVFVTTDPERDTPQRLRAWLDNFDSTFVGVAGPLNLVNALQQSLGLPPAVQEPMEAGSAVGTYGIGHSAVVLGFTPDDSLRVMYPNGTRADDYARDIPEMARASAR